MVDPRPGEAERQDQRRCDTLKAFLEIGAVLPRDMMQSVLRDDLPRALIKGIEIADHRIGNAPRRDCHIGATIGCDK